MKNNNDDEHVAINQPGWYCLRNKDDGTCVGNEVGVTCYRTVEMAMAARTIVTEMMQCNPAQYQICIFRGNPRKVGEVEAVKSGPQAIKDIEGRIRSN